MKKCCKNCDYNQGSVGNRRIACTNIVQALRDSIIHDRRDCCCYFTPMSLSTKVWKILFRFKHVFNFK